MAVVAGALQRSDGRWLMHRRPAHKHHGGLWEFPGGKVETGENPSLALVRELHEELRITIDPACLIPATFAQEVPATGVRSIVILLYIVVRWNGEPVHEEGGEIGWFSPQEISTLEMPPLDVELAWRLFAVRRNRGLPSRAPDLMCRRSARP
ncbi:MAG: hypothetical protein A3J40_06970 [Erythrobacter sp. RIFCSPHIGHO2_12_FULL_63_10]|nr:MAG: hypothetical protein A3J40_06970 [Erythrobacter sp. RIFCSPHIGHO2_12_FULL_63_10]